MIILNNFKRNFEKNWVKQMEFYFQSNFIMNSLKCPKSKSLSHCLTELFLFYHNKHWTIQRRDDCSVDPSFHCIILKIVGFLNLMPQASPYISSIVRLADTLYVLNSPFFLAFSRSARKCWLGIQLRNTVTDWKLPLLA